MDWVALGWNSALRVADSAPLVPELLHWGREPERLEGALVPWVWALVRVLVAWHVPAEPCLRILQCHKGSRTADNIWTSQEQRHDNWGIPSCHSSRRRIAGVE